MQDLIRLGNWTINAGLRWDHYQLIVNKQSVDPRFAISRYFPVARTAGALLLRPRLPDAVVRKHPAVQLVRGFVHQPRLPARCRSSLRRAITTKPASPRRSASNLRVDVNYYLRNVNNYADDDQIENTTISFPIAFRKATIYGAEAKIEVPNWHGLSGFVSYSYMVGNVWFPGDGWLVPRRRRAGRREPD